MTTDEYRALRRKLNLTVIGAAPVLGISKRNAQRIDAGETPVPLPVGKLLYVLVKYRVDLSKLPD